MNEFVSDGCKAQLWMEAKYKHLLRKKLHKKNVGAYQKCEEVEELERV